MTTTGIFTFIPLNYETNEVMTESTSFREAEKIRVQLVFNNKMNTNTLIKFYFQGHEEITYTMNDVTTSNDTTISIYSYDLTLPSLYNFSTNDETYTVTCLLTQNDLLNENKDFDNNLVSAHQENNVFTLYPLISNYDFLNDVTIEGEIRNNNYLFSSNGFVYLKETNYSRIELREIFQYKLPNSETYIDADFSDVTNQYFFNLPNDIYIASSIQYRYKFNNGEIIDNENINVIIVDNAKPYATFINISGLEKQTRKVIILKDKTYQIKIKFNEKIPINQNIFQNIYIHNESNDISQDIKLIDYGTIQSDRFIDIDVSYNYSNYSTSQKYIASFLPYVDLNVSNLSLYIKDNTYEDSFGNKNLELSLTKYSNIFDINTESPKDPVVYFPVNQDLRTNLFYGRIEPLDSSAIAWEYEYKTVNGDIKNKLRMNITNLTFQLPEGIYLPGDVVVRTYNNFGNASNDIKNTQFIDVDRTAPSISLNGTSSYEFPVFESVNVYNEEFINITPDIIENITRQEIYILQISSKFNDENEIILIDEQLSFDTTQINKYKQIVNESISYNTIGVYIIKYSVSDDVGNNSIIERQITIKDEIAPTLRLRGPNPQYLSTKEYYEEYGAYAYDNYDGDISAIVRINYNNIENKYKIPGEYNIYYDVQDSSNNQAIQVSRKIIIYEPPCGCAPKIPNFKKPQNSSFNNSNISSKLFLAHRIRNNGKMNSNPKTNKKLKMYKTLYSRDEDSIKDLLFSIGEEKLRQLLCLINKSNLSYKLKSEIESVSNNIFNNLDENEKIKLANICN